MRLLIIRDADDGRMAPPATGWAIHAATGIPQGLWMIERLRPDAILLCCHRRPLRVIREIHAAAPAAALIVVASRPGLGYAAVQAGAIWHGPQPPGCGPEEVNPDAFAAFLDLAVIEARRLAGERERRRRALV